MGALSSFVDRLCVLDSSSSASKNKDAASELSKIVEELEKALHFALGIVQFFLHFPLEIFDLYSIFNIY